jgi:hypothetical protein
MKAEAEEELARVRRERERKLLEHKIYNQRKHEDHRQKTAEMRLRLNQSAPNLFPNKNRTPLYKRMKSRFREEVEMPELAARKARIEALRSHFRPIER